MANKRVAGSASITASSITASALSSRVAQSLCVSNSAVLGLETGEKPLPARGQNEDVINLGNAISEFQETNPDVPIPYVRE